MKRKWGYPVLLTGIFFLLLVLSVPAGHLYGSNTDWFSQHAVLAETIRDECLNQHTLAPAFLSLGGGSNGFMFSYYGYFRPDIIIGCLLPGIPMVYILIGYSLTCWLVSALLCYIWLKECGHERFQSFLGSLLFMTACCFFQTHRQIMFVNYMPFLMMALLCIRKRKFWWTAGCLTLMYFHSFYYAIACLAVVGWYWYEEEGRSFLGGYIKAVFLSIGMAAVLLIPTGLVILEHKRLSSGSGALQALLVNPRMSSLLYSPYGLGLTAICLYCILLGLTKKEFRKKSVIFLVIFFWNGISWLLNGTLYARPKILIPFLPIVILYVVNILMALYRKELKVKIWPFFIMSACLLCYWDQELFWWMAADLIFVGAFLLLWERIFRRNVNALLLLLLFPCLIFLHKAKGESYVKEEDFGRYMTKSQFSEDLLDMGLEEGYRTEDLTAPMNGTNAILFPGQQKSSMYSSVTNPDYARVYYDILRTPIRINNRVAIIPELNPFLQQLMGIRYVFTEEGRIPDGYEKIWNKDGYALSENPQVLPLAYTTGNSIGEEQFKGLNHLQQLEAMTRYTIVPGAGRRELTPKTETWEPQWETDREGTLPDTIQIDKNGFDYTLRVEEETELALNLKEKLEDRVLLVEFDVEEAQGKAVKIDINGIRNKCSRSTAPYPNENTHFQYEFSGGDGIKEFKVKLSRGNYTIKNIRCHTLNQKYMTEKKITPAKFLDKEKNQILSCQAAADQEGYFVTSIPVQRGMRLLVDGDETEIKKVNGAFAGCKVKPGIHEIKIEFLPPGYQAGLVISGIVLILYGAMQIIRRFRRER